MRYAMIMAGGAGTRLWPMSRKGLPKQLVPFIGGKSLLEIAAERLEGIVPAERRYICTGEAHRAPIRRSLPSFTDGRILGEPTGRDTVNAVAFTAAVLHKLDPGAVFAVFTADHLIEPAEEFRSCVEIAFRLVEENPRRLVTFSITPTYPATGFGYVERGEPIAGAQNRGLAFRVKRYVEKPSLEKAKEYLASGAFGWNAGMFVWKASIVLDALKKLKPETHAGVTKIASAWGTKDQQRMLAEVYPTLPKTSVDYALMEPATGPEGAALGLEVATVVSNVRWKDVGSWPSYAETLPADANGNTASGPPGAPVTSLDCRNTLVVNAEPGHRVTTLGLEGVVVVHTKDATLVMPAAQAERLKDLHGLLPDEEK